MEVNFVSQFLLSDVSVHKNHLRMGKYCVRTLTLKNLPEGETYASMCRDFLSSLSFHFVVSQNIGVGIQKNEIDKLRFRRRAYQLHGQWGRRIKRP